MDCMPRKWRGHNAGLARALSRRALALGEAGIVYPLRLQRCLDEAWRASSVFGWRPGRGAWPDISCSSCIDMMQPRTPSILSLSRSGSCCSMQALIGDSVFCWFSCFLRETMPSSSRRRLGLSRYCRSTLSNAVRWRKSQASLLCSRR